MVFQVGDPGSAVRRVLDGSKGVERQADVLGRVNVDELAARQELDRLEVAGDIDRFVLGDGIMLRTPDATRFDGGYRHR